MLAQYLDKKLDDVVVLLQRRKEAGSKARKLFGKWRRIFLWGNWLLLVMLILMMLLFSYGGEAHWVLSSFLYLPQQGWLLPLLLLTPLAVLFQWRALIPQALAVVLVLGPYMHYRLGGGTLPGPGLRLVSNNRADGNHTSISPFLEVIEPDLVLYQEQSNAWEYGTRYPDRQVKVEGQYLLMSKWPIVASELITFPAENHQYDLQVARFEVNYEGQPIAVYSVHVYSPRDRLRALQGRGFFYELLGLRHLRSPTYDGFSGYLAARQQTCRELADHLRSEKLPFLVAGDFNMPDRGVIYRGLTAVMTDSFAAKGSGYGFSFPGTTSQIISGFGPWVRLDYIFASPQWQVQFAATEPERASKHRATAARLLLTGHVPAAAPSTAAAVPGSSAAALPSP